MEAKEAVLHMASATVAKTTFDAAQSVALGVAISQDWDRVIEEYILEFTTPEKLDEHSRLVGCNHDESCAAVKERAAAAEVWAKAVAQRIEVDRLDGTFAPHSLKRLLRAANDVVLLCMVHGPDAVDMECAEKANLDPFDAYTGDAIDGIPPMYKAMEKDIERMVVNMPSKRNGANSD